MRDDTFKLSKIMCIFNKQLETCVEVVARVLLTNASLGGAGLSSASGRPD